jgi:hypothetical protein
MALWRLVVLTVLGLSLPMMAQAARLPGKVNHGHHAVHAAKSHKSTHRTAQIHHALNAG